jgi:hypothetical protein
VPLVYDYLGILTDSSQYIINCTSTKGCDDFSLQYYAIPSLVLLDLLSKHGSPYSNSTLNVNCLWYAIQDARIGVARDTC